jgi:riboflavin kinase/FMN adenylyltransferase
MKVITSLSDAELSQPAVVSIGNFDGLHLGHREILKSVVTRARDLGLRSIALTFSPHPIRFLAPDRAPRLIDTLDQKIRLIENAGIDLLFLAQFDQAFSQLSPEEFVRRYLIGGLKARSVCVGGNFNFGHRQSGTVQTLKQFKDRFEIIEVPPVRVRGMLASSSRIRDLIAAGAVSRACRLLGRWVEIEGTLVSGAGRGRKMSVPTFNLKAENELIPKMGVYVSRISLYGRCNKHRCPSHVWGGSAHDRDFRIEPFSPGRRGHRPARFSQTLAGRDEVRIAGSAGSPDRIRRTARAEVLSTDNAACLIPYSLKCTQGRAAISATTRKQS